MISRVKGAEIEQGDVPDQDLHVPDEIMQENSRSDRLRQLVKEAGGPSAVSRMARVPLGSLNKYLAGREMSVSAAISIAGACKVSLDWLTTGIGPKNPDWHIPSMSGPPFGSDVPGGGQVVQGPVQPLDAARHDPRRTMFTEDTVAELTEALDEAERLIAELGYDPETRGRVQFMLLLRDQNYRGRHGG